MEHDTQHDETHVEPEDALVRPAPPDTEPRPLGAVVVTGVLMVTILVMWFGMYVLNMVRG